jgi:chitosanase
VAYILRILREPPMTTAVQALQTLQLRTIAAIGNVFETSSVVGRYSAVTFSQNDAGHVSYGRAQVSLKSGNLGRLLQTYVAATGAAYVTAIQPYVPRALALDVGLDTDKYFQNLLRAAADDSVMRAAQDAYFDANYLMPAVNTAARLGIHSALGAAVVYDSYVQGSFPAIRALTDAAVGSMPGADEHRWVAAYVAQRRNWLLSRGGDLAKSVYRMDAFLAMIQMNLWNLDLPMVVRGQEISSTTLSASPPDCFNNDHPPGSRPLAWTAGGSVLRGLDVRHLQVGLSQTLPTVTADGVFGQGTRDALKAYQGAHHLPTTGTADAALVLAVAKP